MGYRRKALVTGGSGFIGGCLANELRSIGWSVTILDKTLGTDITDFDTVMEKVKGQDVIFHLAAQADIRKSLTNHYSDLSQNLYGTLNLLEAMKHNHVKDLVFASSSAVYGEATVTPTPETYAPSQTSLYGASKLACESYAQAFSQFMPLRFWAFRFSNVIGEGCKRGVIWDFVHKLKENPKRLEILGDGKQSKEYVHVSDVVSGMLEAFYLGKEGVYNIGHHTQTTVDQVADLVIEEMGLTDVTRQYSGGKRGWVGDNPEVILSIDKLENLGWKPKVSSDEAIRRTVRWTLLKSEAAPVSVPHGGVL